VYRRCLGRDDDDECWCGEDRRRYALPDIFDRKAAACDGHAPQHRARQVGIRQAGVQLLAGIEKDFYFVCGDDEIPRIATVYNGKAFETMNNDIARRSLLPSSWAVSSARGIAKFYNRLCGFDGKPPLIAVRINVGRLGRNAGNQSCDTSFDTSSFTIAYRNIHLKNVRCTGTRKLPMIVDDTKLDIAENITFEDCE
jgi:hypothetical protein